MLREMPTSVWNLVMLLLDLSSSIIHYSNLVRPYSSGGAPLGAVEADCELSIGAVGGRRILCRRS